MKELYSRKEVSKLTGLSERQIAYWEEKAVIPCAEKQRGSRLFDFKALVAFRTVRELQDKGFSARKIKRSIEKLKRLIPDAEQPLTELRIGSRGDILVAESRGMRFTPDGQILLRFDSPRQAVEHLPVDATEELFFQALDFEEKGDQEAAKSKYLTLLAMNPGHVDALVNLGNILHKQGKGDEAEACYRKALRIDPDHVEANYNLANIFEEKNDLQNAVLFYIKAIHEDPEFADAYFNLGRAFRRLGEEEEAKKQWRIYLALDPASEWADVVREQLEAGEQ